MSNDEDSNGMHMCLPCLFYYFFFSLPFLLVQQESNKQSPFFRSAEDYHTNDYPDEEDIDEDYDDLYSEEEENEAYSLNDDDSFLEHRLYDLRRTIHGPNSTEFSSSSHGDESESEGDAREKVHGSVKWALPSSRGTAI